MKFLKALFTCFNGSRASETAQTESVQAPTSPDYVTSSGDVARFIFSQRDLFANGTPRPKLFTPMWDDETARFETSVCGMTNVVADRLWQLGATIRASEGKTALGAALLSVPDIQTAGLACQPWPMPGYPEHGVILGWDPNSENKDARLVVQLELANSVSASRIVRPSPTRSL